MHEQPSGASRWTSRWRAGAARCVSTTLSKGKQIRASTPAALGDLPPRDDCGGERAHRGRDHSFALSRPGQQLLEHEYWLAPLRRALGRPSLNATEAQVTYGAAILSFVGAPHWGFALGGGAIAGATSSAAVNAARLCWGVVPSLLAWPCASCPAPLSLDALSAGLTLAFCVDGAFAACKLAPPNYLWLRAPHVRPSSASKATTAAECDAGGLAWARGVLARGLRPRLPPWIARVVVLRGAQARVAVKLGLGDRGGHAANVS